MIVELAKDYKDCNTNILYKQGTKLIVKDFKVLDEENNLIFDYDSSIAEKYLKLQKKIINLYLDDLRVAPNEFIVVRNVEEAKYYLSKFHVNILSLDHDLGVDEKGNLLPTGYDLVKYICENDIKVNKIYIHTDNPVGRDAMFTTLCSAQSRGFIDKNINIYNYPLFPNKYRKD